MADPKFKHNPAAIKALVTTVGTTEVVTGDLEVWVPARFQDFGILKLDETVHLYGIYGMVDASGNYAYRNIFGMLEAVPTIYSTREYDGIGYYILTFKEGDILTKNTKLIKDDVPVYYIVNEFWFNGKLPWYITPDDAVNLIDGIKYYAGGNVGNYPIAFEAMGGYMTRDAANPDLFSRNLETNQPTRWVGLKSVEYARLGTHNKTTGAYFNRGVASSLVSDVDIMSPLEEILRN